MSDAAANRPPALVSPCISVCEMDDDRGLCKGCLRTLDELGLWRAASVQQRRGILEAVAERWRDEGQRLKGVDDPNAAKNHADLGCRLALVDLAEGTNV